MNDYDEEEWDEDEPLSPERKTAERVARRMAGHPTPLARVEIDGEEDYIIELGWTEKFSLPTVVLQYNGPYVVGGIDEAVHDHLDNLIYYEDMAKLLGSPTEIVRMWSNGENFNEALYEAAAELLDNEIGDDPIDLTVKVIYEGDRLHVQNIALDELEDVQVHPVR